MSMAPRAVRGICIKPHAPKLSSTDLEDQKGLATITVQRLSGFHATLKQSLILIAPQIPDPTLPKRKWNLT